MANCWSIGGLVYSATDCGANNDSEAQSHEGSMHRGTTQSPQEMKLRRYWFTWQSWSSIGHAEIHLQSGMFFHFVVNILQYLGPAPGMGAKLHFN